jgi:Na+/H+ antiporter NhaD/arsenite permease-like protein
MPMLAVATAGIAERVTPIGSPATMVMISAAGRVHSFSDTRSEG